MSYTPSRFVLALVFGVAMGSVNLATAQDRARSSQSSTAAPVDYLGQVKPLLAEHCYSCHGPTMQQSGLRLDQRQPALRGGDYGPVIIPGNSAESKLIRRLVDGDGGMQMPPAGALEADQISLLRTWIDRGAEFVITVDDDVPARQTDPKVARLLTAIRREPLATIRRLVKETPELVNATDDFASTPLHHAAAYASMDTMTWLLDQGAHVNAKNRRSATPLHWAVHDEAKVRVLVARGAAVNVKQIDGRTPLFQATTLGNGEPVVRLLLEHGADPEAATTNGQTPLMIAAPRGDLAKLRMLLDKHAPVEAKNGAGETALFFAATDGNPEAVALLLERGADAKVRRMGRGTSPRARFGPSRILRAVSHTAAISSSPPPERPGLRWPLPPRRRRLARPSSDSDNEQRLLLVAATLSVAAVLSAQQLDPASRRAIELRDKVASRSSVGSRRRHARRLQRAIELTPWRGNAGVPAMRR